MHDVLVIDSNRWYLEYQEGSRVLVAHYTSTQSLMSHSSLTWVLQKSREVWIRQILGFGKGFEKGFDWGEERLRHRKWDVGKDAGVFVSKICVRKSRKRLYRVKSNWIISSINTYYSFPSYPTPSRLLGVLLPGFPVSLPLSLFVCPPQALLSSLFIIGQRAINCEKSCMWTLV